MVSKADDTFYLPNHHTVMEKPAELCQRGSSASVISISMKQAQLILGKQAYMLAW